ncbi:hypothetical protein [Rhizobium lusitanum]|uniref:Uncharacterized protein n=1 Tax=Rhizobium lusitanum TaxID=293958 RepID=A0A7X0IVA4_9HYPH|nr:hypothetical protein [Rhizobium lusitanum]MBB6487860.1 hypothetical protein [Rhizobium lusitanum]
MAGEIKSNITVLDVAMRPLPASLPDSMSDDARRASSSLDMGSKARERRDQISIS